MKKKIHIHIGDTYASGKPAIIDTVLGSCVAVCLFERKKKIGGMNHILLPGRADMKFFDDSARYGINAMEILINKIIQLGGKKSCIVAKAFGGANILSKLYDSFKTGDQNIEFVTQFLKREKIRLLNYDLGGFDSRKIFFHTDTNEVLLKRIRVAKTKLIVKRENEYFSYVKKVSSKSGRVDLF